MFEVEFKARVDALGALRGLLGEMGADPRAAFIEEDVYYAHPGRDFAVTDEALRVRTQQDTGTGARSVRLTYKGPRAPGPTRSRAEHEVAVEGDLAPILEALGFRPAGQVRKRREIFFVEGATVTLDEVDGLGEFAEIEVVTADAEDQEEARRLVLGLAERLGLGPEERRSYLELVLGADAGS